MLHAAAIAIFRYAMRLFDAIIAAITITTLPMAASHFRCCRYAAITPFARCLFCHFFFLIFMLFRYCRLLCRC